MNTFDKQYAKEQIRRGGHPYRRLIKHFYLNNVLQDIKEPAIDFGCGAGQLLSRLSKNSVGLEINPYLVAELKEQGLNVCAYDFDDDNLELKGFPTKFFKTFVISHVLEHFKDASLILKKIFVTCNRLQIERIVIVVPGKKGYQSDATHQTFVNYEYMRKQGLLHCEGFTSKPAEYFPVNAESVGDYFVYNELKIVFEREKTNYSF